jgi:hypothetical protein
MATTEIKKVKVHFLLKIKTANKIIIERVNCKPEATHGESLNIL